MTGGVFQNGELIEFRNSNNDILATLDPETGEIKVAPAYIGQVSIDLDFKQQVPIVQIRNSNQINIFSLYLKPKNLSDTNPITLLNGNYTTRELTSPSFGDFV